MSRSRLVEVMNKKIIGTALLTAKFCPAPVASTCRFRYPEFQGSRLPCNAPIDTLVLQQVITTVDSLHETLDGECVDCPAACSRLEFRNALAGLAQSLLCPMHAHSQNVVSLAGQYLDAIVKAATNELHTTQTLAENRRKANVDQIVASIGKAPRMHAERAGYMPRAAASAAPGPLPAFLSGIGQPDDPYVVNEGIYGAAQTGARKRRRPEPALPRPRTGPVAQVSAGAWEHSIKRYTTAWSDETHYLDIIAQGQVKSLKDILAFPCLTGRIKDADETTVATFYDAVTRANPSSAVKFLRDELLSWHPDRIDRKFTGIKGKEEVKEAAAMVFRIANEALEKAKAAAVA